MLFITRNNKRKDSQATEDSGLLLCYSVMVSAADGDPSVALAVQCLVRYLLQQELPKRPEKKKPEPKKAVPVEEPESPLQETGEKEVCNP